MFSQHSSASIGRGQRGRALAADRRPTLHAPARTAGLTLTVPDLPHLTCILAAVCLPVPGVEAVAGSAGSARRRECRLITSIDPAASSTVVHVANCPVCMCETRSGMKKGSSKRQKIVCSVLRFVLLDPRLVKTLNSNRDVGCTNRIAINLLPGLGISHATVQNDDQVSVKLWLFLFN